MTFLGDTYLGEWYQNLREQKGRTNFLKKYGYDYSFTNFASFLQNSDCVITNLECALTERSSPFKGKKTNVLAGDPEKTAQAFIKNNIAAVSLGNNHALDYGVEGLKDTLNTLERYGIESFGAGSNRQSAQEPFLGNFTLKNGGCKVAVISGYYNVKKYEQSLNWYADSNTYGVNNLNMHRLKSQIKDLKKQGYYVILCPHWGILYFFRNIRQHRMAIWMVRECEPDLIIGHGSHMAGEIHRIDGTWILYSIGNFIFNNEGLYRHFCAPPFSFIVNLHIDISSPEPQKKLQIYPIFIDNQETNFQPRFVTEEEFIHISMLTKLSSYNGKLFEEKVTFQEKDKTYSMEIILR